VPIFEIYLEISYSMTSSPSLSRSCLCILLSAALTLFSRFLSDWRSFKHILFVHPEAGHFFARVRLGPRKSRMADSENEWLQRRLDMEMGGIKSEGGWKGEGVNSRRHGFDEGGQ